MKIFEHESQNLRPETLKRFIISHVSNAELKGLPTERKANDLSFSSNEDFWSYIINSSTVKLHNINLHEFRISNWFPRVPGIYYTLRASRFRADARNHLISDRADVFYDPHGKSRMVRGGTGSVKFQPIMHEGELFWLCTATSDSYCHTGIPLFIPNFLYEKINFEAVFSYSIRGRAKFLPNIIERRFMHYTGMPKLYIQVESIRENEKNINNSPLLLTPVVYFKSSEISYETDSDDLVTFAVCNGGAKYDADAVFEWFLSYTRMYNGRIMTNFDEQCPLFEDAPFSLQKVMREEVLVSQLQTLIVNSPSQIRVKNMNSHNNTISIGDGNHISGNVVAAQSVSNSFKSLDKFEDPQIKDEIAKLEEAVKLLVEGLSNKQDADSIARDAKGFCEEANAEAPRENTLKHYLGNISEIALKAGALGIKVVNVISTLSPFVKIIAEHTIS